MENKIRKLIREVLGHYFPLDDVSNRYAKMIMEILLNKFQEEKRELYSYDNLRIQKELPPEDRKISKIWNIDIRIIPSKEDNKQKNCVSGRFMNLKQDFIKSEFRYSADFEIYIINWDYKTDLTGSIEKVFSHELFHAFQYIVDTDTNGYSKALYKARNEMEKLRYLGDIRELKNFMNIFYLSLPQEVNARVHEAYNQMENIKLKLGAKSHDEVLKELNKLSVFRDFLSVQYFQLDSVLNLFDAVKKDFVRRFNENLLMYKNEEGNNSIKIIYNPDEFFKYWVGRAKNMSLEARHKIVSQAINLFPNKNVVTEYCNPKYDWYGEQIAEEIFHNISSSNSNKIYHHALTTYYYDSEGGDEFWEELKNYSKFLI